MTTKATVAFSPSASILFGPLRPRCPPRDICWGRGGCGLRLAASVAAGLRAAHVVPKKRETEQAANVEEEAMKESKGSIPRF